jgi:glucose dehydrogenase
VTRFYLVAASLLAAVTVAGQEIPAGLAPTGTFVPITQAMQANPDPGDWLHISRTYNQHRFSPLNQINKGNVALLRMAWSRGLPAGTQESTPIVYRGVMYVMAPGASIMALDASNGDVIWHYERDYP